MAITLKVQETFNKHINAEFWSAYLYLSMSSYFHSIGLNGFANWMRVQYQEEKAHAEKFYDYIISRGGIVDIRPIPSVPNSWKSVVEVYESTLTHEIEVTRKINELVAVSMEEHDFASINFLQWFVNEQVEEEANIHQILDSLRLVQSEGNGLFLLDREMKTRVFVPANQTPAQ